MLTDTMHDCEAATDQMQMPLVKFEQLIAQTKDDVAKAVQVKVNDKEFALQLPALQYRKKDVVVDCSRCDELWSQIKRDNAAAEKALDRKLAEMDKFQLKYDDLNAMLGQKEEQLGNL